jgi:hypothetical protein
MTNGMTIAMCTYRVKEGKEDEFLALLGRHWPTLRRNELVTATPSVVYRGSDAPGKTFFVEFLEWANERAPEVAHHSPGVLAVWEPMGMLVEERLGRP